MKVTLQTNKYNTYKQQPQKTTTYQTKNEYPNFSGNLYPSKSNLFKPFENAYDSLTEFIARKFVAPAMDSAIVKAYAIKTQKNKKMINHINAFNSLVISGLYMNKTLTNKQMDKDRKKTLAINQGMTFVLSTGGAYWLDGVLNKKWGRVTEKFAELHSNDKNFKMNFTKAKDSKLVIDLEDYVSSVLKNDNLAKKIKAMDVAKKLLVFAMVYRYITPVLVTPIANKIGDHLLQKKKAREAAALKAQNTEIKKA